MARCFLANRLGNTHVAGGDMLRATCACGKSFTTDEKNAGRKARCPKCAEYVTFPEPALAAFEGVVTIDDNVEVYVPPPRTQAGADAAGIMARLGALEAVHARMKSRSRWSLGVATLALAVALLTAMSPGRKESPHGVIREQPKREEAEKMPLWPGAFEASAFVLHDHNKKVRGAFWVNTAGETSFEMTDPGGVVRASLLVKPDGSATLGVGDVRRSIDAPGLRLIATPGDIQGFLMRGSRGQKYDIHMGVDDDPTMDVAGPDGRKLP